MVLCPGGLYQIGGDARLFATPGYWLGDSALIDGETEVSARGNPHHPHLFLIVLTCFSSASPNPQNPHLILRLSCSPAPP